MSDVDSSARLIAQLEADYCSSPVSSGESNLDSVARELKRLIKRNKIPVEDIQSLLSEPENIIYHQDISLNVIQKVSDITKEMDYIQVQKLAEVIG